jgi:hypothetical protein
VFQRGIACQTKVVPHKRSSNDHGEMCRAKTSTKTTRESKAGLQISLLTVKKGFSEKTEISWMTNLVVRCQMQHRLKDDLFLQTKFSTKTGRIQFGRSVNTLDSHKAF